MKTDKPSNEGLKLIRSLDHSGFNPVNILLANIEELKKESFMDENLSPEQIRPAVVYAQDVIVERITGDCLLNQLKLLIYHKALNQYNYRMYRRLLDEYLFPVIQYAVQFKLVPHTTFKLRNQGIIRSNDSEHVQYPGLSDVKYIQSELEASMDFYVNRAIKWLRCNRECFCELCGCQCDCDCGTAPFQEQYSVSLNIGIPPKKRNPYA